MRNAWAWGLSSSAPAQSQGRHQHLLWAMRTPSTAPPWSHGPGPSSPGEGLSLTVVLLAVLFHVNLQLPFGGLAVGIAVYREGRAQTKPN